MSTQQEPATAQQTASVSSQIFNSIQGQEAHFPLPVARRTFTVGTFDAASGSFAYSVPTRRKSFEVPPESGGPSKPHTLIGGQIDAVNVVDVILRFDVSHRQGDFSAVVGGAPAVHTSTANALDVEIGAETVVDFTLSCAG